MNIYQFTDYKRYMVSRIESDPALGRGSVKKIAEFLRVHPSLISQILKGQKDFSPEQARDVAAFLGMDDAATEYFMCLVDIERAGTSKLKSFLLGKRDRLISVASQRPTHNPNNPSASNKANVERLNSNWFYPAVCLLCQIPKYQSVSALARYLHLPTAVIDEAVDTLVQLGLVIADGDRIVASPVPLESSQFLDARRFHMNWRLKAIDRINTNLENDRFITLPVALSTDDRRRLKQIVIDFVEQIRQSNDPGNADDLSVLTIDMFGLK
jgi:uncharacterized protein (TIGR02147 family)